MVVVSKVVLSLLAVLGAIQAGLYSQLSDRFSASYAYAAAGICLLLIFAVGWAVGGLAGKGLQRAFKRPWAEGEPRLMAELLGMLGAISDRALAAEQLAELEALAKLPPAGSPDRLHIVATLANTLAAAGRVDDGISRVQIALEEFRQTHGGRLTQAANEELALLVSLVSRQSRYVQAESIVAAELKLSQNTQQRSWLLQQLYRVYYNALDAGGSTAAGKGLELYRDAQSKIVASLEGQQSTANASGIEVPVRITGPWDKPKYEPDLKGLLADPNKAIDTVKQLGKQFKGKTGKEIVDAAGRNLGSVIFTSYHDETTGIDGEINRATTPAKGDWGGLVFRGDSDRETEGIIRKCLAPFERPTAVKGYIGDRVALFLSLPIRVGVRQHKPPDSGDTVKRLSCWKAGRLRGGRSGGIGADRDGRRLGPLRRAAAQGGQRRLPLLPRPRPAAAAPHR